MALTIFFESTFGRSFFYYKIMKTFFIALVYLILGLPCHASEYIEMSPIVVTAQKEEQDVQTVPVSMSVIDCKTIERTEFLHVKDLGELVPNLHISKHADLLRSVTIRGVGSYSRNIGFDSRVGVYLDGVYVGQSLALNQDLLDIERVEVLRGPQGTFFGQNTVAGAINLISSKPESIYETRGNIQFGEHEHRLIRFTTNIPIQKESLFARISVSHFDRDGFSTNIYDGEELDNQDTQSFRAQFLKYLSDQGEFKLSLDGLTSKRRSLLGDPLTDTFATGVDSSAPDEFEVNYNHSPQEERDLYGISGTYDFEFKNEYLLTTISSYRQSQIEFLNDADHSFLDIVTIQYIDKYDQFSQEIRLMSPREKPFEYILALHYFHQTGETDRSVIFGNDVVIFGDPTLIPGGTIDNIGHVKTNSYSFMTNGRYHLSHDLQLDMGFRCIYENKNIDYRLDGSGSGLFNIASAHIDDSFSESAFLPSVGITYFFEKRIMGYAKVTTGYKSPGYNLDFVTPADISAGIKFDKEKVTSYEIGLKSTLFNKLLRINAALFHAKYDDYQVNQFIDLGGGATSISIRNAAEVISKGVEFEISAKPVRDCRIDAGFSFLDTYFKKFPGGGTAGSDATGNDLPFAPRVMGHIGVQYSRQIPSWKANLILRSDASYLDEQFTTPSNVKSQALSGGGSVQYGRIDSVTLFSAKIGIHATDNKWAVSIWAKNITDKKYITDSIRDFLGTILATRGEPRTMGIDLRYCF